MNRRAGYSILEVLIAFAVMSMTLAVLLPGQTQLLGRAATASERALAHDYALSRLEVAHVLGSADPIDRYDTWQIRQEVTAQEGQRRITITVLNNTGRALAQVTRAYGIVDAE